MDPEQLAQRLAHLTGQQLSSASESAIAAALDSGYRRFDAHQLYPLSVVFEVALPAWSRRPLNPDPRVT